MIEGATVAILSGRAKTPATLWLVRHDLRTIQVAIRAGENGGRTIPHRNIVRDLIPLGTWTSTAKRFPLPSTASGMGTPLLLQAGRGGPIIAAIRAS